MFVPKVLMVSDPVFLWGSREIWYLKHEVKYTTNRDEFPTEDASEQLFTE